MAYRARIYDARLYVESTGFMGIRVGQIIDDIHDLAVRGATGGPYSKGALAGSIYKTKPFPIGWKVRGRVGSPLSYAASVEGGAEIHNIFPKGAAHTLRFGRVERTGRKLQFGLGTGTRRMLAFYWRGSFIVTPHVPMSPRTVGLSHPGQRGKRFLLNALLEAAAKWQMKIDVYEE